MKRAKKSSLFQVIVAKMVYNIGEMMKKILILGSTGIGTGQLLSLLEMIEINLK